MRLRRFVCRVFGHRWTRSEDAHWITTRCRRCHDVIYERTSWYTAYLKKYPPFAISKRTAKAWADGLREGLAKAEQKRLAEQERQRVFREQWEREHAA